MVHNGEPYPGSDLTTNLEVGGRGKEAGNPPPFPTIIKLQKQDLISKHENADKTPLHFHTELFPSFCFSTCLMRDF